ncbi:hypothetical protein [Paenibacillus stellifer]|nr:hypothetical protein [Paenibacillus stellifer]
MTESLQGIDVKIPYLHDPQVTFKLTYDAKNNLYTVSAKGK